MGLFDIKMYLNGDFKPDFDFLSKKFDIEFLNCISDPLWIYDKKTKVIIFINDPFLELFSISQDGYDFSKIKDKIEFSNINENLEGDTDIRTKYGLRNFKVNIKTIIIDGREIYRIILKQNFNEIERKHHLLSRVLNTIPSVAHIFDFDTLQNIFVNGEINRTLKYTTEEFTSLDPVKLRSLVHPDDSKIIEKFMIDVLNLPDDQYYTHEYRMLSKEGKWRYFQSKSTPFSRRKDGSLKELLGITTDVTHENLRKSRLIEKHKFIQSITDNAPLIIFIYSLTERRTTWMSKHVEYDLGYTPEEFVALTPNEALMLFHPEEFHIIEPFLFKMQNESDQHVHDHEFRIRHKNGEWLWFSSRNIPFTRDENGEVTEIICVSQNINSRKIAELKLEEAKLKAEEANRAKSKFLANMSHEIRTPLNSVMGFTQLLEDQIETPILKSYLSSIRSSSKTLLDLLNDILDLSKIEAKKITLKESWVNFSDILDDIRNMFIFKMSEKNIYLTVEYSETDPKYIFIDEIKLRQILINLISNAIKFTPKGDIKVVVNLISPKDEKSDIEIDIIDDGIGISEDQKETIFKAFEQQRDQDISYGGTGLGLTISKNIAQLMGGDLKLVSSTKNGSRFKLILNSINIKNRVDISIEEKKSNRLINFEKTTILYADDIEDSRVLVKNFLEDKGITVLEAKDGIEAIDILKSDGDLISVILMDLRMPRMDGLLATKKIREMNNLSSIPIIALTASILDTEFHIYKKDGFNDFISKPINSDLLIDVLKKYLPYKSTKNETEGYKIFDYKISDIDKGVISLSDLEKDTIVNILESDWIELKGRHVITELNKFSDKILNNLDIMPTFISNAAEEFKKNVKNFDIVKIENGKIFFDNLFRKLKS